MRRQGLSFPPASAARKHLRGFTLMELVMVIVLLGLLSIVALPRFGATEAVRTAAFRDEVVAAMRYARSTAISHRRLVCADVSTSAVTLRIAAANPAVACTHSLPGTDGNAAFARSAASLITSGTGTIHFQPAGTVGPAAGGTGNIVIAIRDEQAVTIVGKTGHVE